MGYQTKSIADVVVKGGQTTNLDISLDEPKSKDLQEVVIRGSYKQETINALYVAQKNNPSISSGISGESIRRSPDRNTSEVLKRVSGASIQDNKYIIVRGLNDRYNTATINNAMLPSTEPDRKAFSFDLIPSNLIDNIVINKTASRKCPQTSPVASCRYIPRISPLKTSFPSISASATTARPRLRKRRAWSAVRRTGSHLMTAYVNCLLLSLLAGQSTPA